MLGLSVKLEKKELGREGKRWEGELRDGNAFEILLNASWPADLDRFLVGPRADPKIPFEGRDVEGLVLIGLGSARHGEGRGSRTGWSFGN